MKEEKKSNVSRATYTIKEKSQEQPVDGTIMLNNSFFKVAWSGARNSNSETELTGTQGTVTITYSLGSSANMYCNDSQIRMYGGNSLKVETSSGEFTQLAFMTIDSTKKMTADKGSVSSDYVWTGKASEVTFEAEANHIKISGVNITFAQEAPDAIHTLEKSSDQQQNIYNMQGQRVMLKEKGLYIINGKKVILK